MKRWIVCVGLAIAAAVWAEPAAETKPREVQRELDLVACTRLAEERSEWLSIMDEERRAAEARYWQAVTAILPDLRFTMADKWQTQEKASIRSVTDPLTAKVRQVRDPVTESERALDSRFTVSQTVFRGLSDWNGIAAAKHGTRAARLDREQKRQQIYLDTGDLFYQIISYGKELSILAEQKKAVAERIGDLAQRVEIGRSRKSELLAAKASEAAVDVSVEQVRGLLAASRELLAYLIGLDAGSYRLADKLETPSVDRLERYLAQASERPDVQAALARDAQSRRTHSAVKGGLSPTLDVQGNYIFRDTSEVTAVDEEWNIVVRLDVPIFDRGLTYARAAESAAHSRAATLDLARVRRSAQSDVKTAYARFESLGAQVVALSSAEAILRENYDLQKADYETGRSTNLDVLTALVDWQGARRSLVSAQCRLQTALVALLVASGESAPGIASPSPAAAVKPLSPAPSAPAKKEAAPEAPKPPASRHPTRR